MASSQFIPRSASPLTGRHPTISREPVQRSTGRSYQKMKNIFMKFIFSTILPVLLCVGVAHSQTVTGSIAGQVTDSTGAVIAGAQVVAHNIATGVTSAATT